MIASNHNKRLACDTNRNISLLRASQGDRYADGGQRSLMDEPFHNSPPVWLPPLQASVFYVHTNAGSDKRRQWQVILAGNPQFIIAFTTVR
jgi:hypothetical protein